MTKSLFQGHHQRLLTTMRNKAGKVFLDVYKFSVVLLKLLDGEGDSPSIEIINVPEQQASPIYVKIEDDQIILDVGRINHPLLRKEALDGSRKYLQNEIDRISQELNQSNIDRRFVVAFFRLKELLRFSDDSGAIALGLHARGLAQIAKEIEKELPEVLSLQISSMLVHTSYFASQYKDWIDFVSNAQQYPAKTTVDPIIDQALGRVASTLDANSSAVDKRIPETVRIILRLLRGDAEDRLNAMFAGIRGVENICIAGIRYAYEQATELVKDVGKTARPVVVKIGAGAVILITWTIVTDFLPVIKNAPEINWIMENIKQIEKIKDILK